MTAFISHALFVAFSCFVILCLLIQRSWAWHRMLRGFYVSYCGGRIERRYSIQVVSRPLAATNTPCTVTCSCGGLDWMILVQCRSQRVVISPAHMLWFRTCVLLNPSRERLNQTRFCSLSTLLIIQRMIFAWMGQGFHWRHHVKDFPTCSCSASFLVRNGKVSHWFTCSF